MNKYLFDDLIAKIELPKRAYELATERYEDLGEYLTRTESNIARFKPSVTSQGSFRLGTAIRPLNKEEYDVDLNCVLHEGVTEKIISQKDLKEIIGGELNNYKIARNIKAPKEEKRRCWRLLYADEISFHLDIVPAIPAPTTQQQLIRNNIIKHTPPISELPKDLAEFALYITDRQDPDFEVITDHWHISNPEGYARWFESKMLLGQTAIFKAEVADIPKHTLKTPLQRVIQILKRHRDVMYSHPNANTELKPISIIITTLAAQTYSGENNLTDALRTISSSMKTKINSTEPRVPNPVNPEEDFADKWKSEPALETHFHQWLTQLQNDLFCLLDITQQASWPEIVRKGFNLTLDEAKIKSNPQRSRTGIAASTGTTLVISPDSPRPWGN